jgi:phosphatidylglycerol:prolipoprotein diacylglycerol transferase
MHWTGKVESVAFTLFGKDVMWYGIIITSAMLIGLLLVIRLSKKMKLTSDDILELFLIAIPLAIVGARLGYVLLHADYFFVSPFGWDEFVDMIAIWDGGLTIITGAPFGILGGYLRARKTKSTFCTLPTTSYLSFSSLRLLAAGGNFFNQKLYGMPVTDPNLQYFPYAVLYQSRGRVHQATFFYKL